MKSKKSKYLLLAVAAMLVGSALWYRESQAADVKALSALKREKPALTPFVDEITMLLKKKVSKNEQTRHYLTLGLAWKGLADRTGSRAYYQEALRVYEKGIKYTGRKNTVLINNAGNMFIYLKDYRKAAKYYEESIRLAPGDGEAYVRLANLHRDYLKSPSAVIIAIYDKGIKRMVAPGVLVAEKAGYLRSLEK